MFMTQWAVKHGAAFSFRHDPTHLATLSFSHCMHELKMLNALFTPVMTGFMLCVINCIFDPAAAATTAL